MTTSHIPVFSNEVLKYLYPRPDGGYIDATADGGGHAVAILEAIQPTGKLLAIEWDDELFEKLKSRLQKECSHFSKNYEVCRMSYIEIERCIRSLKFGQVWGALFDLGLSSFHLEESRRGFSFQKNEPLDMRYSKEAGISAAEILARSSRNELADIFKNFGEERFASAIAKAVVDDRQRKPIRTTTDLVAVIHRAMPYRYRRSRIHFATRTFQALRIAVNHELENIPKGLEAADQVLARSGRIVTIAFHSLEDAVIKNFFRRPDVRTRFRALTPKPLRPSQQEIITNPRSRSARLRAFEKIA